MAQRPAESSAPSTPGPIGRVTAREGEPLYQTVKTAVRAAIDSGAFAPGARLPSTKALSEHMAVSLVTVHRALQELVGSGVLRRGQGKGTFVHEDYATRTETSAGLRFGLVFHGESSLADHFHGQILEGVRQGADELGVDLVLLRFGEDWRNECQGYLYVNPFMEQLDRSPRFAGRAGGRGNTGPGSVRARPVMVVGASFDKPGVSMVDTDNRDIARQGVQHLCELGHRRIAYVGGSQQVSNNLDRFRGFSEAMHAEGEQTDTELIIGGNGWRLDDTQRARLQGLLWSDRVDRPTAVFAAGYYFALDVYESAREAGLRIPDDLSVISVDDPPSAEHLSPPLTTLRQPLVQLGKLAVRGLFDQVGESKPVAQRTSLRAELVIRKSTAERRG